MIASTIIYTQSNSIFTAEAAAGDPPQPYLLREVQQDDFPEAAVLPDTPAGELAAVVVLLDGPAGELVAEVPADNPVEVRMWHKQDFLLLHRSFLLFLR